MVGALPEVALIAPADSARAAATVYTVSLLATVPIVGAVIAAVFLRRAGGATRALVWRSTLFALALLYIGRHLPLRWSAVVVPSVLAQPLVELGRIQIMGAHVAAGGTVAGNAGASGSARLVREMMLGYWFVVAGLLLPAIAAFVARRRDLRRSTPLDGRSWAAPLTEARLALGIRRQVRLYRSATVRVPVTWGVLRPVIVLPTWAASWNADERRMVLTHELAHVAAFDWLFGMLGRIVCALYWFHPGAWWVASRLREDRELACDDRVLARGSRRSDYAELLVRASTRLSTTSHFAGALPLSHRRGLRARLAAVLDPDRAIQTSPGAWRTAYAWGTALALTMPAAFVQLAPSRDLLTSLVHDTSWESRAYAVQGLAERPDSVAVAQTVAELDPSPRVRAWAKYALGQAAAHELRRPLEVVR